MKHYVLTAIAIITLCSCDRENNSNNTNPGNNNTVPATLRMKMNGTDWVAEKNTSASVAVHSTDGTTDQIIVKGALNNGDDFQITTAKEVNGPGTYNLPSTGGGGIQYTTSTKAYNVSTAGGPATITITEIKTDGSSKYVKGSFEGTLKNITNSADTIVITKGEFNGINP